VALGALIGPAEGVPDPTCTRRTWVEGRMLPHGGFVPGQQESCGLIFSRRYLTGEWRGQNCLPMPPGCLLPRAADWPPIRALYIFFASALRQIWRLGSVVLD